MAYDGELVRMENGRWARFQKCRVCASGSRGGGEPTILVAVELSERYQELLDAAEGSLEMYRRRGIPVHVRLDPDADGKLSVSFEEGSWTPSPKVAEPVFAGASVSSR